VPAATAESVAQFFLHYIVLRHGAPRILLSDRGRQFVSRLVNEFLRHCNTIHKTTTSYHPKCNGLTERFNHTLADMISAFVNYRHSDWDKILPFLVHAYNTAVQSSTGYSPFFFLFLRAN